MNISNLLQLLAESREISEINEKARGKVPDSVLKTLSSLMKGPKYDPTAMMIINKIQDWEDDEYSNEDKKRNLEFLKKRPKLVYFALKEAAKGSSNYNPAIALMNFYYGGQEPIKYWSDFRAEKKAEKEEPKEKDDLGLKGVKPIETKDAYLFIPRGFKEDENGLRVSDLDKQQEELKRLSQQMAKKDTSEKEGADVNHWCVAADKRDYYKDERYKGGNKGGIFIIIVKKNKDGSPNWNKRYLYWNRGPEYEELPWDYDQEEFADKFDDHVDYEYHIPESTREFIEKKIISKLKVPKGDIQKDELEKRVASAEENEAKTKSGTQRVNRESSIVKNYLKVLNFLKKAYEREDAWREEEDPGYLVIQHLRKGMGSGFRRNIPDTKSKYYTISFTPYARNENRISLDIWKNNNNDRPVFSIPIPIRDAGQIAGGGKGSFERYIDQHYGNHSLMKQKYESIKPKFDSKSYLLYDDEPPKGVKDALKNNKFALDIYRDRKFLDAIGDDEIKEFFIGPYFMVTVVHGRNTLTASSKPWDPDYDQKNEVIGDLRDSDILEKVKKAYQKYVAEGSANV